MSMCASAWVRVQKWATAYSISAPKIKLKQIPKYTSMALMKQLALGSDVRAPIIRVVMVSTVVTPGTEHRQWSSRILWWTTKDLNGKPLFFLFCFFNLASGQGQLWTGVIGCKCRNANKKLNVDNPMHFNKKNKNTKIIQHLLFIAPVLPMETQVMVRVSWQYADILCKKNEKRRDIWMDNTIHKYYPSRTLHWVAPCNLTADLSVQWM